MRRCSRSSARITRPPPSSLAAAEQRHLLARHAEPRRRKLLGHMGVETPTAQSGWPALFWEAFTHSKNAMVLLDDQRRHVEVNGAYLQLIGYRRSDLIGHPVYEFLANGPVASPRECRALLRRKQFTGVADLLRLDRSQ